MKMNYKDVFGMVKEKAEEYAPDLSYLETDLEELERYEQMLETDASTPNGLSIVLDYLYDWYPDEEEEELLEELDFLMGEAKKCLSGGIYH